jgi:Holliday junction resolvasome RuvABC endonuclease subunit
MNNLTFDIDTVEDRFKIKLKRNATCLAVDPASKSGICVAKTDDKTVSLSISFINVDVGGIKDQTQKNELRYSVIADKAFDIITDQDTVSLEDVYYSRNPGTLILLARIGAIFYTIAKVKKIKRVIWNTAVSARKKLGLPCNKKKEIVQLAFCKKLKLKGVSNEDEIDSVVLALVGLLET